jgi:hypothetical protein
VNKIRKVPVAYKGSPRLEISHGRAPVLSSLLAVLLALATVTLARQSSTGAKDLSRAQARTVVLTFLKSQGYKTESPRFDLESDPDDPDPPEFYMFHAYYNTTTRLNSIGTYAANRKTASLWERVACEQLKSKALQQVQNRLRKEIGLPESEGGGSSAKPCL